MSKAADEVDKQVGARLKQARNALGLSQEKLAAALGITFQQVQKYEKGINRVSASRLKQAAKTLEVSLDYFYDGSDEADDGQDDAASTRVGVDPGLTADGQRLVRAFMRIGDPRVRRDLLRLVETIQAAG